MRLFKSIVYGLVVVSACFVAPQLRAANAGAQSQAGYTDESINRSLRDILNQSPAFAQLGVTVSHGAVTLTGAVARYQDKIDAENAARQMPGVHTLRSQISLTTPVVDDMELEDRVQDQLRFARADVGLSFPDIQVEAHKGVVYLTGTVNDPIAHAAAVALAGNTEGVQSVRDKLSINSAVLNDDATRLRVNKAIYRATRENGEIGIGNNVPVRASFINGSVTLIGSVANARTREDLLSKIQDVSDLQTVEDEVTVRNPSTSFQQTSFHSPVPCGANKDVIAGTESGKGR